MATKQANSEQPITYYSKPRCPVCNKKSPVYSSEGKIRRHKCKNCGQTFKSIEAE